MSELPDWLQNRLASCPPAGSGVHAWLFGTAKRLHEAGIQPSAIEILLRESTATCGRRVSRSELTNAINNSAKVARVGNRPIEHCQASVAIQKPAPDPGLICVIVESGFGLDDLWERSPIRFENGAHTEEIIDLLFPGDPLLCCGKAQWDFATARREAWRGRLSELSFIVPNPMVAETGLTQEGKPSQHSLRATAARVYLPLEFDFSEYARDGSTETIWRPLVREWRDQAITVADACAALHWQLSKQLPLVAAVHSGGKSLHGWYAAFDQSHQSLKSFFDFALKLGADPQTWTRSQFVRMPDGRRDNGARQPCYYLDPRKAVN
jgi:hypothetical protein